jgi:hypothetical protein
MRPTRRRQGAPPALDLIRGKQVNAAFPPKPNQAAAIVGARR